MGLQQMPPPPVSAASRSALRPPWQPDLRPCLRQRLDRIGIGLAGLCALHCLAALLVVPVLGLGGHFLLDQNIHQIGLALALVVAAVALVGGLVRHRRVVPLLVSVGGLALMALALVVPHGVSEFALTLAGVSFVALGHVLNLRAARCR